MVATGTMTATKTGTREIVVSTTATGIGATAIGTGTALTDGILVSPHRIPVDHACHNVMQAALVPALATIGSPKGATMYVRIFMRK